MSLGKNYYSPVDVAIRWGHYTADEEAILHLAVEHPQQLFYHSKRWPTLHLYLERLCDAIDCHELPAWYLGHPLTFPVRQGPDAVQLRAAELRFWFLRCSPDDKPDFLFAAANDHRECVSLTAYLALQVELDAANKKIQLQNLELAKAQAKSAHPGHAEAGHAVDDRSAYGYQVTIAALLSVTVGKSGDGQVQSIYKTQSALTAAITRLFPGISYLSKHTLDRKFSEARRILIQEK